MARAVPAAEESVTELEAENVVAYITRIVLDELREIYPEILSEDVRSLPDGLSRVKDKTGQKFIIIIDE